jgi:chemotaxis protein methyltransferase CheR
VFCRNALTYFGQESKAGVLDRLARQIEPDGYLVLGAAETVVGLTVPTPSQQMPALAAAGGLR